MKSRSAFKEIVSHRSYLTDRSSAAGRTEFLSTASVTLRVLIAFFLLVASTACGPAVIASQLDSSHDDTDSTALRILNVDPTNGSTGVPQDGRITLTFSEPLAAASVTSLSVIVASIGQQSQAAAGQLAVDGNVVTFDPDKRYGLDTRYAVFVTSQLESISGHRLLGGYESFFSTKAGSWHDANLQLGSGPRIACAGSSPHNGADWICIATGGEWFGGIASLLLDENGAVVSSQDLIADDHRIEKPVMSIARDGSGLLAFVNLDDASRIWVATIEPNQSTWSIPRPLGDSFTGTNLAVAAGTSVIGERYLVWETIDSSSVWGAAYNQLQGWEAPRQLNYAGSGAALDPAIALDPAGNAVVVWAQAPETGAVPGVDYPNGLWWTQHTALGPNPGWEATSQELFNSGLLRVSDVTLALSSTSGFVVWRDGIDIAALQYNLTSETWSADKELVASGNGSIPGTLSQPAIVLSQRAFGYAMWLGKESLLPSTDTCFLLPIQSGVLGRELDVVELDGAAIRWPTRVSFAADDFGAIIWTWDQQLGPNDSRREVWSRRFNGAALTEAEAIFPGTDIVESAVALSSDGRAIAMAIDRSVPFGVQLVRLFGP